MNAKTRLRLREDVAILKMSDIDPKQRERLECSPDDYVISQYRGRATSKLIDSGAAALLGAFDPPCSLAEAVLRFCDRSAEHEPPTVLETAFPLIESLVRQGILIDADALEPLPPGGQSFQVGESFAGWTIVRCLQSLDGCEVYQVRRGAGWAALKLQRFAEAGMAADPLAQETRVLSRLAGQVGPQKLESGEAEHFRYLLLEWCPGLELQAASREWREPPAARKRILTVCQNIARAYSALHRLGVLHGDVHPRNILIDRRDRVGLVDFGAAQIIDEIEPGLPLSRPGVAFYFEPEHARSMLEDGHPTPISQAGEQFAVGAVLYEMVTGTHYWDFDLEARALLRAVAEQPPVSFQSRKLQPWPTLESVLHRALAKVPAERYGSMAELAEALAGVESPADESAALAVNPSGRLGALLDEIPEIAGLDGPWLAMDHAEHAEAGSIAYGAGGVALALLRISFQQDDPYLLSLADLWCQRAKFLGDRFEASLDDRRSTSEFFIQGSPYHSANGLRALTAMIASARSNRRQLSDSVAAFVTASRPVDEEARDLFAGLGGTLQLSFLLLELIPDRESDDAESLREVGRRTLKTLWRNLDHQPPLVDLVGAPLGLAHGWAGLLYATLEWSRLSHAKPPASLQARLEELAALAIPVGNGQIWKWPGDQLEFPGSWCQGSAGQVFLWAAAADFFGKERYQNLAVGAGETTWQVTEANPSLCCGLIGQAYALLRLFRQTSDSLWLDRARILANLSAELWPDLGKEPKDISLFQGRSALALLAADLKVPARARFPFFEADLSWPWTGTSPAGTPRGEKSGEREERKGKAASTSVGAQTLTTTMRN